MALYELAVAFIKSHIGVFYGLILTYLFYLALKLTQVFKKKHDLKYLVIAVFVLIGAFNLWSKIYEDFIKAFFEQFRFLLVLVPLAIFLIYTVLESKRAKANEEKQKLRGAFQQYVSPSVVEEITKHPEKLKLGGEKKELTVFFSDIRGFTTLSEKLTPEELVSLLNEYLSQMTDIVLEKKGLVDKYIGDAIMAFWGAPMDDKDHAVNACKTALEMKAKLAVLSQDFQKRGLPEIKIGMGINSGDMVVGNMGSNKRFDYTVIGDNVNLASRLEGQTKQYVVGILISQSTYDFVKDKGFAARELDSVAVKGKTKPIKIYELVGYEKDLTQNERQIMAIFRDALELYLAQKWPFAIRKFEEAAALGDETSKIYITRCRDFMQNPPPSNWDGVYVAKSK